MMNGTGQAQPTAQKTYDGNIQVAITLSLAAWTMVLNQIAELPWKTADPLLKTMNEQIAKELEAAPGATGEASAPLAP